MKTARKKTLIQFVCLVALAMTVVLSYWQSHSPVDIKVEAAPEQEESRQPADSSDGETPAAPSSENVKNEEAQAFAGVKRLALKVGSVSEDPRRDEEELRRWAGSLNARQIRALTQSVLRGRLQGDERFLVAELLVANESPEALRGLGEIALNLRSLAALDSPTSYDVMITQMRAVEGLAHSAKPEAKVQLREFLRRSDNSYLVKFARTQMASL